MSDNCGHHHKDEHGVLVKCYHKCKTHITSFSFWLGMTIGFPIEHALWEHVPPFCWLTKFVGL